MVIPSSCGMFVYRLVTSIETKIAFSTTLVFSMKLIKSVVSLRYDFCDLAIGWRRLSTNDEIHQRTGRGRWGGAAAPPVGKKIVLFGQN